MAEIQVTQEAIHVLAEIGSAAAGGGVLSGQVPFFIISGTSYVNAIGTTPLVVSAEWNSAYGTAPFVYNWQFSNVGGEAGFTSTATTSNATRTYTYTGGTRNLRGVSATISDANSTASATYFVHLKAETVPNPYDGNFQGDNQGRRKVFP